MTNRIVAPSSTLWTLASQQGPGHNQIPLSTLPWVVGRRTGADLFLAEPSVSGRHAEFFEKEGSLHVRDLGSTNGTFVNGAKVGPQCEVKLTLGDLVQFG